MLKLSRSIPRTSLAGMKTSSPGRKRALPLTKRFREALSYAARLHAKQKRKGTNEPYIGHLLGVASLVLQYGGGEDDVIAALLHDAAEDQGGLPTLRTIEKKFGLKVGAIVEACSDSFETPKPAWRERKQAHIAKIRRASSHVKFVCAADKLHNARSILADYRIIGERLWKRFSGKKEGTLWYYREMAAAVRRPGSDPLADELDRVVRQMNHMAL
jgi:(p)ppGpp synthase/HD superfamily hydrolase